MTTHEKLKQVEELLREIYQTNEGPRLIEELLRKEFPNPRKIWNDTSGWGMLATQSRA